LDPAVEKIWSQIFLDDGTGQNGKTSQLGEYASLPIMDWFYVIQTK
jgi:hypothetical protein